MSKIPQDVLDRVLAAHDIVEVVGRSLPLKKTGRAWKACCPFHEEKTPSFTVNPDRQSFKCFGCGKGGNVFGWLMEREGLKFFEAVRALAAEKGIPVPDAGGRGDAGPDVSRTQDLRKAVAFAQDLYVRTLWGPAGEHARAYLEKRGFPPPASRALGLGLSPEGWDGLLVAARAAGLAPDLLQEAGLVVPREGREGWYDRFRGRLMFPIADVSGRIVTYGARALREGDNPKYLNGPETALFKKGRTLYALDRAKDGIRKAGHAILMEGYTDVLMAHLFGFTSAVAGMGTAFTPEQATILARHATKVILLYDGDAAGRAAAEKSLDLLLEQGLELRVAMLPEGRDVDEVLLEEGADRLTEILGAGLDVFDFKVAQLGAVNDLKTERGRATAASKMAEMLVRVKSPMERDLLFSRVADRLGVNETLLRAEAARIASGRRPPPDAATGGVGAPVRPTPPADPRAVQRTRDLRMEQERLIAGAIYAPEHLAAIRQALALRYRLLPYLWGAVEEASRSGLPVQRAMVLACPDDPAAWAFDGQWMCGPDLLVAACPRPGGEVELYLPRGRWRRFPAGGEVVEGGRVLRLTLALDDIAVFARDGARIPMGPATTRSTADTGGRPVVEGYWEG